jgi:hypothetical protein
VKSIPNFGVEVKYGSMLSGNVYKKALANDLGGYSSTCESVEITAIHSHITCYSQPTAGGPLVCDLTLHEMMKTLRTIKAAFVGRQSLSVLVGGKIILSHQAPIWLKSSIPYSIYMLFITKLTDFILKKLIIDE